MDSDHYTILVHCIANTLVVSTPLSAVLILCRHLTIPLLFTRLNAAILTIVSNYIVDLLLLQTRMSATSRIFD